MNTVKRVEVRNMKDFEIKTTYNVLNKSFDTEAEAKEYARNIKTVITLYIGSKSLEQWIEEVIEHIVSNENTIREESRNYRNYHLDNIHYETSIYYDENDLTIDNLACISFKKDFGIKITEKQLIK